MHSTLLIHLETLFDSSFLEAVKCKLYLDSRFLEPLTSWKYPDSMRRLVGARFQWFTSEEAKDLKGSFDFLGCNYYSTLFTIDNLIPIISLQTNYILDAQADVTCKLDLYKPWKNCSDHSIHYVLVLNFYFQLIYLVIIVYKILILKYFMVVVVVQIK